MVMMADLYCTMCYFVTNLEKDLMRHYVRKHRTSKNFHVTCCAVGCFYSTKSWPAFRVHYSRNHRRNHVNEFETEADPEGDMFEEAGLSTSQKSLRSHCASFALRLMTQHKLPASSVDDIIESVANLVTFADEVKQQNPNTSVTEALKDLSTHKLRVSYLVKNCRYIPPVEVILGQKYYRRKGTLKQIKQCGYVIPFKESLQNYLNQPDVWQEVIEGHESGSELMKDFCDGSAVRNDPFIQSHENCLLFAINTDSFEVVNAIGCHTRKHKVDVFYWQLLNVKPATRSKWSNIHLLAICKTKFIKKYGMHVLLDDFIQTLRQLRQGIQMRIRNVNHTIFGVLLAALCDTPASAALGGMKESSSFANRGCRTCTITKSDMQKKIRIADLEERCPRLHRQRCHDLETMPKHLKPFWSKFWGINGSSPLLKLDYINLAQALPQDPLHVCLEGVFAYGTALIIKVALEEKLFDLDWLNMKIKNFPLSYLDSDNSPEQIYRNHIFDNMATKQTAACHLTLCYILPYILHDQMPHLEPFYKNFMHLVAIVCLCCSPYCTIDTAGELQQLVEGYLQEFQVLYPRLKLRPKQHFLLHFCQQLISLGPLRSHWLFRYESMNNFFKNFKVRNFINLALSLAKYHQLCSCYAFQGSDGERSENLLYSGDTVKEGKSMNFFTEYPNLRDSFHELVECNCDGIVYETSEITVHGHTYRPGACLLFSWEDSWPQFRIIQKLCVFDHLKFAVCAKLETVTFEWKLNAYEVEQQAEEELLVIKNVTNNWPLPMYKVSGKMYITNRYSHFGAGFF